MQTSKGIFVFASLDGRLQASQPLGYDLLQFPGGERHVRLTPDAETKCHAFAENIRIEAHLHHPAQIIDLMLITDAVRRACRPRTYMTLIIPYVPYARQDRAANPGEAHSAKVFCQLINSLKYDQVVVWDAHSDVTTSLLDNVQNVPQQEFAASIPGVQQYTLVAPDAGAAKKVKAVFDRTIAKGFIQASKSRDTKTGAITGTELPHMIPKGPYLIVDDICDGGRTFTALAKAILDRTDAEWPVDLYVTHGIFSQGVNALLNQNGGIRQVFCANPWPEHRKDVTVV